MKTNTAIASLDDQATILALLSEGRRETFEQMMLENTFVKINDEIDAEAKAILVASLADNETGMNRRLVRDLRDAKLEAPGFRLADQAGTPENRARTRARRLAALAVYANAA